MEAFIPAYVRREEVLPLIGDAYKTMQGCPSYHSQAYLDLAVAVRYLEIALYGHQQRLRLSDEYVSELVQNEVFGSSSFLYCPEALWSRILIKLTSLDAWKPDPPFKPLVLPTEYWALRPCAPSDHMDMWKYAFEQAVSTTNTPALLDIACEIRVKGGNGARLFPMKAIKPDSWKGDVAFMLPLPYKNETFSTHQIYYYSHSDSAIYMGIAHVLRSRPWLIDLLWDHMQLRMNDVLPTLGSFVVQSPQGVCCF